MVDPQPQQPQQPRQPQHEAPTADGGQWHLAPDTYLQMVRSEMPAYDRLQVALAEATRGETVRTILDLGSGTGVTAEHVLRVHPDATLTGVDSSAEMLRHARHLLPDATFVVGRLGAGVDLPSTVDHLLAWLTDAGLRGRLVVDEGDLAVIAAVRT